MSLEVDRLKNCCVLLIVRNNSTLASRRYTRLNPDPDPPPVYENPNLIVRIHRRESPIIHLFKSPSCPGIFKYLEELDFDEQFELSLFKTKSESALDSLGPNPDFAAALEVEKHNKLVENFTFRHLQRNIQVANLADFLEAASANIRSSITDFTSKIPTQPPFIPTLPLQPIITYQKSAVNSPSSSHIATPLHTPSQTTPRPNPPRAMAARFASLAFPRQLHEMPRIVRVRFLYLMALLKLFPLSNT